MSFRVHVRVMPRGGLLDPQGQAVEHALSALGFGEAGGVRVGRAIELQVSADHAATPRARVRLMCDRLLANPGHRGLPARGGGELMLRVAVVRFPGSNCDFDSLRAVERAGLDGYFVWHRDTGLQAADVVVLPGGFSYGDYLRSGAIARFSPIMQAVQRHAADGGAGARHLQRISDSLRGAPASRARS